MNQSHPLVNFLLRYMRIRRSPLSSPPTAPPPGPLRSWLWSGNSLLLLKRSGVELGEDGDVAYRDVDGVDGADAVDEEVDPEFAEGVFGSLAPFLLLFLLVLCWGLGRGVLGLLLLLWWWLWLWLGDVVSLVLLAVL